MADKTLSSLIDAGSSASGPAIGDIVDTVRTLSAAGHTLLPLTGAEVDDNKYPLLAEEMPYTFKWGNLTGCSVSYSSYTSHYIASAKELLVFDRSASTTHGRILRYRQGNPPNTVTTLTTLLEGHLPPLHTIRGIACSADGQKIYALYYTSNTALTLAFSTTGGASWTTGKSIQNLGNTPPCAIWCDPTGQNVRIVASGTGGYTAGAYYSTDAGQTFTKMIDSTMVNAASAPGFVDFFEDGSKAVLLYKIIPEAPATVQNAIVDFNANTVRPLLNSVHTSPYVGPTTYAGSKSTLGIDGTCYTDASDYHNLTSSSDPILTLRHFDVLDPVSVNTSTYTLTSLREFAIADFYTSGLAASKIDQDILYIGLYFNKLMASSASAPARELGVVVLNLRTGENYFQRINSLPKETYTITKFISTIRVFEGDANTDVLVVARNTIYYTLLTASKGKFLQLDHFSPSAPTTKKIVADILTPE